MKTPILALEASSPEELSAKIKINSRNGKPAGRFAAVAVSGPQILVRPFELDKITNLGEARLKLKLDAIELLGLPAEDIEFDFQILSTSGGKLCGIFTCCPHKLLQSYLSAIDKAKLFPVKVFPSILASFDTYFKLNKVSEERICLLDFTRPNLIYLAVFEQKKCQILREIHYENALEAKNEVIQSLRSATAKSQVKTIGAVYFSGEWEKADELRQQLEKEFNCKTEKKSFVDVPATLVAEKNFFSINLSRGHAFTLAEHKNAILALNVALAVLIILTIFINRQNSMNQSFLNAMKASFTVEQYKQAQDLEKRVAAIKKK